MRRSLLVGVAVVAPLLFASSASACGWGCDCAPSYGYSYGYSAPLYGYSSYYRPVYGYGTSYGYGSYYGRTYGYGGYYRPGVRFYGARTYESARRSGRPQSGMGRRTPLVAQRDCSTSRLISTGMTHGPQGHLSVPLRFHLKRSPTRTSLEPSYRYQVRRGPVSMWKWPPG